MKLIANIVRILWCVYGKTMFLVVKVSTLPELYMYMCCIPQNMETKNALCPDYKSDGSDCTEDNETLNICEKELLLCLCSIYINTFSSHISIAHWHKSLLSN